MTLMLGTVSCKSEKSENPATVAQQTETTATVEQQSEATETEILAENFNWLCDIPAGDFSASVRVRHTKWETPNCHVHINADGSVRIQCEESVRAPAAGQSAVLYSGEQVLGGGFII